MSPTKEKTIRAGFTLIELLVVISIIALLLSIMLPALKKAREQAKTLLCRAHIKQIALCASMYAMNNKNVFPPQRKSFATNDWWFAPESNILTPYFGEKTSMRKVAQYGCPTAKNEVILYNAATKKADPMDYTVSGHFMPFFDTSSTNIPWAKATLANFVKSDGVKKPSYKMLVADIGPTTFIASFWNTNKIDSYKQFTIGTPHKGTNVAFADFSVGFLTQDIMEKILKERETGEFTDKYIHPYR